MKWSKSCWNFRLKLGWITTPIVKHTISNSLTFKEVVMCKNLTQLLHALIKLEKFIHAKVDSHGRAQYDKSATVFSCQSVKRGWGAKIYFRKILKFCGVFSTVKCFFHWNFKNLAPMERPNWSTCRENTFMTSVKRVGGWIQKHCENLRPFVYYGSKLVWYWSSQCSEPSF